MNYLYKNLRKIILDESEIKANALRKEGLNKGKMDKYLYE